MIRDAVGGHHRACHRHRHNRRHYRHTHHRDAWISSALAICCALSMYCALFAHRPSSSSSGRGVVFAMGRMGRFGEFRGSAFRGTCGGCGCGGGGGGRTKTTTSIVAVPTFLVTPSSYVVDRPSRCSPSHSSHPSHTRRDAAYWGKVGGVPRSRGGITGTSMTSTTTTNDIGIDEDGDGEGRMERRRTTTTTPTTTSTITRCVCYLLRSTNDTRKTYIGITNNMSRRIRQHNGELSTGGARRTRRHRPWTYVAYVHGFDARNMAMKFEWHWQHASRSKVFRCAVGSDAYARKMKRRTGVRARLDELRILLGHCPPFDAMPLKIHFIDNGKEEVGEGEDEHYESYYNLLDDDDGRSSDAEARSSSVDEGIIPARGETTSMSMTMTPTMGYPPPLRLGRRMRRNEIGGPFGGWSHRPPLLLGASAHRIGSTRRGPSRVRRTTTSWSSLAMAGAGTIQERESDDVDDVVEGAVRVPSKFKPYPFPYHEELIVRIESLTNLGFGIARVELGDANVDDGATVMAAEMGEEGDGATEKRQREPKKWVVFCPNVIPGELVRVRIYRNFASYSDADLLHIIEPSPDRIEPACPLATICGGCQYQHIDIDRQRMMKTMQVQELFERLGGLSPTEFPAVLDTIGTGEVYGYRSKITPHYDAPMQKKELRRARNDGDATTKTSIPCEIGPIGFKEKASHRLVDVPYCHIATPKINDALHRLREEKREEARRGVLKKPGKGATLLLRDSNGAVETNHTAYVNATVKGLVFRFQAGNFFQNNPYMLDLMVDLVVDAATAASPDGMAMTHLIDCYCGSGLFCIGSSSHFDVCVGIEVNEMAITEARDNALLNGIRNCDFVAASAEAIFSSDAPVGVGVSGENEGGLVVGDFPRDTTVVVLDPPRKGCSEEFLDQLNEYRPARVVYMSCDPATQARDAKSLLSFGYRIVSIQPFDLFPQTRHIECLAVFERMNR